MIAPFYIDLVKHAELRNCCQDLPLLIFIAGTSLRKQRSNSIFGPSLIWWWCAADRWVSSTNCDRPCPAWFVCSPLPHYLILHTWFEQPQMFVLKWLFVATLTKQYLFWSFIIDTIKEFTLYNFPNHQSSNQTLGLRNNGALLIWMQTRWWSVNRRDDVGQ